MIHQSKKHSPISQRLHRHCNTKNGLLINKSNRSFVRKNTKKSQSINTLCTFENPKYLCIFSSNFFPIDLLITIFFILYPAHLSTRF